MKHVPRILLLSALSVLWLCSSGAKEKETITHSFLATGAETRIVSDNGQILWQYPRSTRDGWVLPNGNVLLAFSKDKDYPSGAVAEVTRDGKVVFEFKGT